VSEPSRRVAKGGNWGRPGRGGEGGKAADFLRHLVRGRLAGDGNRVIVGLKFFPMRQALVKNLYYASRFLSQETLY